MRIFGKILLEKILDCTVNIGDCLGSPANMKGANKDAEIYVGRSTNVHNLLFCPHTLCINYATKTFLLISSSARDYQGLVPRSVVNNYCVLCTVKVKKANKNLQQRTLSGFIAIPLY